MYLNTGFAQVQPHGQLLASEHVRVLRLLKGPFKLVQLERRECRPGPANFAAARFLRSRRNGQIDFVQRSVSHLNKAQISKIIIILILKKETNLKGGHTD